MAEYTQDEVSCRPNEIQIFTKQNARQSCTAVPPALSVVVLVRFGVVATVNSFLAYAFHF
jgi:hypothetical protein